MSRVVVVGAGMGGLAAAARLAAGGHTVTVCESAPVIGGKLGEYRRDGYRFDTGPSLLTLPDLYRELFADTGGPLDAELELVRVDPAADYRFADGSRLILPDRGTAAVCGAIEDAFGGGTGRQWAGLLDRGAAIWAATRDRVLGRPVGGLVDLARLVRPADLATVAPWATLRGIGRRHLRDPRLGMLLDRYATYTGSDPRRAPAALASVPYVEQAFGSWYVRGGLRRLGDALAARATERGAVLRCDSEVTRVLTTGGRVAGVALAGGERLPADVVVSDVDAAALYGRLLPRRRLAPRGARSLAGFVLLLGLRGPRGDLAHHTVAFPADYDAEFDAIFGPAPTPVADPTIYLAVADDPAVAPAGAMAAFLLVNAPRHGPVDWDAPGLAERYAGRLLDLLAARGVDLRDRLDFVEWRTPADLERAAGAPGGAIYGTSSHGLTAAFRRPANASPVPGLFLVGGSAHPGGGLPLVALSARNVAGLIGPA